MSYDFIEEKTPKGFTLKIYRNKLNFLVFDSKGGSVYCESDNGNVLHKIPTIVFLGSYFIIKKRIVGDYNLLKASKNKIIVPYNIAGNKELKYFLLDTEEKIDMVPVKIINMNSVIAMIKEGEDGLKADLIVIDDNLTENEAFLIKSRFQNSKILKVELKDDIKFFSHKNLANKTKEITDINLNMMSENPVFLARVHLRNFQLSKVKQLLLDFDLTADETKYIATFIDTLLADVKNEEVKKNLNMINELHYDFDFYYALLTRNKDLIEEIVKTANSGNKLSSYLTLIVKAESIIDEKKDKDGKFFLVDVNNLIHDRKEELQKEKDSEN